MKKVDRAGEKHINNEGQILEIVESHGTLNCTIRFNDGTIVKNVRYGNIQRGNVKNPYHKSVYGVGYFGIGKYTSTVDYKIYNSWKASFQRCYDVKYQEIEPTYKGCSIIEEWHNFQVFGEWYEENYKEGFALDKDILFKGNKVYSSETCIFVPREVNNLFRQSKSKKSNCPIGVVREKNGKFKALFTKNKKQVYLGTFDTSEEAFQAFKNAKESHIKEIADKYEYDLDPKVYQIMYNYQVEITD